MPVDEAKKDHTYLQDEIRILAQEGCIDSQAFRHFMNMAKQLEKNEISRHQKTRSKIMISSALLAVTLALSAIM